MTDFTLVYGTNIWSPHQVPLAKELSRRLRDRFTMALFEQVHEERRRLGWSQQQEISWVIGPPTDAATRGEMDARCLAADVLVCGACPGDLLEARAASGKLTLVMAERRWKKPFYPWRLCNPRFAAGVRRHLATVNRPNVHFLAMGAYAAEDERRIGAYGDRIWSWAYFPEVNTTAPAERTHQGVRVLWVGRMLDWKRVDLLLRALRSIVTLPDFAGADIVGDGPERGRLLRLAHRFHLPSTVRFHEPMAISAVREMMRQADIYILPSNRNEGWGAVANEAMSEGCVLVANAQAGAAPVLIRQGETGFLFRDNEVGSLVTVLTQVIGDPGLRARVTRAAWQELMERWTPSVGAERLIALCAGLLGKGPLPAYTDGPCRHLTSARGAMMELER